MRNFVVFQPFTSLKKQHFFNHHHHGELTVWIPLILLYSICPYHQVFYIVSSIHTELMNVFAGWPTLVCPYVGVHWRTLLMSSFLLHQQCPAYLADLNWMAIQLLFCRLLLLGFIQNSMQPSCVVPIWLFSKCFVKVQFCNYTVVLTQLQLGRILVLFYQRSDFHIVVNLSIAVHALFVCLLTLLSVDEILLPNWSANFKDLPFKKYLFTQSLCYG